MMVQRGSDDWKGRGMQYGFMMGTSPREPIERFANVAKVAEDHGFSMGWVGDSQLIFKNAYVAMTLAAKATASIRMGPGVTPSVTRHISEIANAISAINEVSEGRAVLGLGVGDSSVRPLGIKPATIDELRDQVTAVRGLTSGEEVEYQGRRIHMRPFNTRVPIYIAASQPRMLRLAGEIADGVVLLGAVDRSLTEWQLRHVEEGARAAGRDLEAVAVDLYMGIALTSDLQEGRQAVRAYATSQARWFSRWKELPDVLGPFDAEMQEAYRSYDFYHHVSRHATHNQLISDELVDLIAAVGPAETCAERISELADLKVDRISFLNIPGGRESHVVRWAKELLPLLSGRMSPQWTTTAPR
jgi:5,10-methylenetetrahydromethanopterin reductase